MNKTLEQERLERERLEMIMAQNDVSAVSLDGNIENTYIGQEISEPEPEVLYSTEARKVVRSLNHLETRRVMLVNTVVGTGSVGRLVAGLYDTLSANGYECMVAYGRDTHPEGMNAYRIGQDLDVYIHGVLSRLTDRHGFYSKRATVQFINVIEEFKPDIIHLHNVHGYYLNIRVLFEYLKSTDIRVIWTLHDCWTFTGHCSHFEYIGCNKWINGCYSCEQLAEGDAKLFLETHATVEKLKLAEEKGAQVPELHYLLSGLYNPALHLDERLGQAEMLRQKLDNVIIKRMVQVAWGS